MAGQGQAAGINMAPLVDAANGVTRLAAGLQGARAELAAAIAKAEQLHDDLVAQGEYVTGAGCAAMAAVREGCDALEVMVGNEHWPLPRYREMLFPV